MGPPQSFSRRDAEQYQKRIDGITGTRDGRPIVKLAWAPDELRWTPHPLPDDPIGYTFPIFCCGRKDGELVAAPRWVLLERAEPQHYAHTWEAGRFSVHDGRVWDWRGPCPPERYTELKAHCYHDGECCPCHGTECECGEEYDHCWGKYLDPNERLLDWIRMMAREAEADSDVKPNEDIQNFSAPNAQREAVNQLAKVDEKRIISEEEFGREMAEFWARKPVSTGGLKRTESGIYLLN